MAHCDRLAEEPAEVRRVVQIATGTDCLHRSNKFALRANGGFAQRPFWRDVVGVASNLEGSTSSTSATLASQSVVGAAVSASTE